jgi:predicted RND superfamily exporter protein
MSYSEKKFLKNFNRRYIHFLSKHYIKAIIIFTIVTIVLLSAAFKMRLNARMYDLFPKDMPSIINISKMEQYYGGEGYLIANLQYKHPYSEVLRVVENINKLKKKLYDTNDKLLNTYYALEKQELIASNSQDMEISNTEQHTRIVLNQEALDASREIWEYRYRDFIETLKKSEKRLKTTLKGNHQRYNTLFLKELSDNIIKDTEKQFSLFKADPNSGTFLLIKHAIEEDYRAIDLYTQTIKATYQDSSKKELISTAEIFAKEMGKNKKLVSYVDYKFNSGFVNNHLLYFLDKKDLQNIYGTIEDRIAYERKKNIMSSELLRGTPIPDLSFKNLQDKYLRTSGGSKKIIRLVNSQDFFDHPNQKEKYYYYINEVEDTLVVLVKPTHGSPDITFDKKLLQFGNKVVSSIMKNPLINSHISIEFHGRYKERNEDVASLNRDFNIISPISTLLVFLAIVFYFKNIRAIIIVCAPLFSDIVWAVGIAYFTIGSFNLISSFLIAIMSGLGVNFSTHLYSRYREERFNGNSVEEALGVVFQTTFVSNVTATLTTAIGFAVLGLSRFQGFSEFGIIAGMGMLCLLSGVFLIFPSVVFLLERIKPLPLLKRPKSLTKEGAKNKPMPFFRTIIVLALIMTTFTVLNFDKVPFNANFTSLISKNGIYNTDISEVSRAEDILGLYNLVPMPIYLKDYDSMVKVTDYLTNDKISNTQIMKDYKIESLSIYLPNDQKEKKVLMQQIKGLLKDHTIQSLKNSEDKKRIDRLMELCDAQYVTMKDIPDSIMHLFIAKDGGYLILYYATSSISKIDNIKKYTRSLENLQTHFAKDKVFVASDTIVFNDIFELIKKEAPLILSLVFFTFILILWLDFRSWKLVILSLLPLSLGLFWVLGFYYLFGFEFNYFNIVMFPVIISMGLDDGVHMLHRYYEEGVGGGNLYFIFINTGKSIMVAALTDIIGFGALMLALYNGLVSIGQFLTVGVFSCVLVSSLLLPSIFQFVEVKNRLGWKKALFSRYKS